MIRTLFATLSPVKVLASLVALAALGTNPTRTMAGDFEIVGQAFFTNVQDTLQFDGSYAPYYGLGLSQELGGVFQSGSVLPTTQPVPIGVDGDVVTLQFEGVQGPNPIPWLGNVHIITTNQGTIFCTWKAVFTIELDTVTGDSIFSGDGDFTIVGGTGRYRGATGKLRTLFETDVVSAGSDVVPFPYSQSGEINLKKGKR